MPTSKQRSSLRLAARTTSAKKPRCDEHEDETTNNNIDDDDHVNDLSLPIIPNNFAVGNSSPPRKLMKMMITSVDMNQRIQELFETSDVDSTLATTSVVSTPCLSARIFACFSLYVEGNHIHSPASDEDCFMAAQLMSLLRAMVQSEVVALGETKLDDNTVVDFENKKEEQSATKKVVPVSPSSSLEGDGNQLNATLLPLRATSSGSPSPPFVPSSILKPSSKPSAGKVIKSTEDFMPPQKAHNFRIHFSGFDFSATHPPVDRLRSAEHQHESIQALRQVLLHVNALTSMNSAETLQTTLSCLSRMVDFLRHDIVGENAAYLCVEAAKSISPFFPPKRLQVAARQYGDEFEKLKQRMERRLVQLQNHGSQSDEDPDKGDDFPSPALDVEQKLAYFLGQASRYQLRTLLNDSPPRLTPADTTYNERAKEFSKVAERVVMKLKKGDTCGAVDDQCMSALVSLALRRLYEYFGLDDLLNAAVTKPPNLPALFCNQPATTKGMDNTWTDDDVNNLLEDIDDAYSFLAAAHACRFLVELFRVEAVQQEIRRCGGWSLVETYATLSWQYNLYKLCEADAHLVLLCNYDILQQKLIQWLPALMKRISDCSASLQNVSKRFELTSTSTAAGPSLPGKRRTRRQIPPTKHHKAMHERIKECFEQRKQMSIFPTIQPIKTGN